MIVVKVELHSAITGEVTTLCQATICNDGKGTYTRGNYNVRLFGKNGREMSHGFISAWPRKSKHVWHLILKALEASLL